MSRPVGPGRPPVESRFAKGQSGNPKGRPKKPKPTAASAFDIVIDRTLTVTQGGQRRAVTVEEALQHRTYQDAIAGNRAARREVLKMIAKREQYLAAKHARSAAPRFETRLEPEDPDNADAALLILGIAARNPNWKGRGHDAREPLLEPWAVQAALSRRRGGAPLTDEDIAEIKRCTRAADTVRWPRKTAK
jgi:hypothetical protein